MKKFTENDIISYYDSTEVHYRRFWKFEQSLGLHYGVWDKTNKTLADAILNTNALLAEIGLLNSSDYVLDAGCGVGGSSIFIAKKFGCKIVGITLSEKQVKTAAAQSEKHSVSDITSFQAMSYYNTSFDDNTFDVVWAIESFQTAADKNLFFKEVRRILKPGGRLLIGDVCKAYSYSIDDSVVMQEMINGWAMSDILTFSEIEASAAPFGFSVFNSLDVTKKVYPSVNRIFAASILGMYGTFFYILYKRVSCFSKKDLYNLYKAGSYFSRRHYRTGLAQYFAYHKKLWKYYLIALRVQK